MPIKSYVELLKLRIGGMIALTAVVAYLSMAQTISLTHIAVLTLAMFLGASSSAVFNHYYDRDIDQSMTRTAKRPLAQGLMKDPRQALWLALGLLVAGVGLAAWYFNPIVALHLFMGAFVYGVVYTVWLKRRTWLNIVLGGLAGSFAVLAGAASVRPELCALPLLMALVLFFWTPSHFWSLAIYLKDEYRKVNVPMLPVLVGNKRAARYILMNSVLLVASSLLPWIYGKVGLFYGVGAILSGGYLLYGNWQLIQNPSREVAWKNFLDSMRYLGTLFIVLVLDVQVF